MAALLPGSLVAAVQAAGPGYALFDADGTLWRDDVGEAFLRHTIELGWVKAPAGRDPYELYEEAIARDRATGYAYAAQLLAGLPAAQVQAEAMRFAAGWVPPRLIDSTQALVKLCKQAGLSCAVVSASQIDVVRAAVVHAGIAWDRCVGISTRLDAAGCYTDSVIAPIIYAEGKVIAAVQRQWSPIRVAAGDSIWGDLAMLSEAAVPICVAGGATPLCAEALKRGWSVLSA